MVEFKHQSSEINELILASWAPKTISSYDVYIKKWVQYCKDNSINDPHKASYEEAMSFIADLYNNGYKYGTIANARSALSAILPKKGGVTFGQDPMVSKLLKSIFRLRPTLPKHTVMYDPELVLNYINELPHNYELMLEMLTKKLVTLLCLLSGQRVQAISSLRTDFSKVDDQLYTFYIPVVLKTTKPGRHQAPLQFQVFPHNNKLCVVNCLKEYTKRTDNIRENLAKQPKNLILSYAYPHLPVGPSTIARYVKQFLGLAGIDLTVFTAHSTRSASTSKANNIGLSMKDIQKAAGWTNDSTFRRFYDLPLLKNFGTEILKSL